MDALSIAIEDPRTEDVRDLLQRHFDAMRAASPAESCHVMAPETLSDAEAVLFGARQDGVLLGVGALATIGARTGELKSMHTVSQARGKGVARLILRALIERARAQGLTRVSLETGTADVFAAARAFYRSEGFEPCAPFGSYVQDPLSMYFTRIV